MIELSERNFMKKHYDIYDMIRVLAISVLTILLLVLSSYSLVVGLVIPIGLAIFFGMRDLKEIIIVSILIIIMAYVLEIGKNLSLCLVSFAIFALALNLCIKFDFKDIDTIMIMSILSTILFNLLYYYVLKNNFINLGQIKEEMYNILQENGYNIPKEAIGMVFSRIPSVISILATIYSVISYKLVRNYLSIKKEDVRDMVSLNRISIGIRELAISFVVAALAAIILKYLNVRLEVIRDNILSIAISLIQINGLMTLDFALEKRGSKIYRIISRVLIILLFGKLALFFLIIGGLDILFGLRARMEAISGREE